MDKTQDPVVSIGVGVTIKGRMTVPGLVVIEGLLDGELQAESVIVGTTGQILGRVETQHIEVSGRIQGQTQADHLWVRATGSVQGEIRYGVLEVERGGELDGPIMSVPSHRTPDIAADASHAFP